MADVVITVWPCGLRRRSEAARLLGLQVRIPLRAAWMFVDVRLLCLLYVV